MNSGRGRDKKKKNRILCKTCGIEMNKGQYVQHLETNDGNCPGNRKLNFADDHKHIIKKIGRLVEVGPVGLDKKNGLNGKMGQGRYRNQR